MSRSRESKRINRQSEQQHDRLLGDYSKLYDDQLAQRRGAEGRSNQAFNRILEGYDTFGRDMDEAGSGYREFSRTGGIDPEDYDFSRSRLQDFVNSKGMSDENRHRIRGLGVFDEFAKTGGWNDQRKQDFRARAGATGKSIFSGLRDEAERMRAAGGGYTPGDAYEAGQRARARDSTRAADEAMLNAETEMAASIDAGRKWGSGSASDAESRLVGQESQNFLGGMGELSNLYGQRQQGRMFGTQGLESVGRNRAQALETLRGARADVPGEVAMYNDGLFNALGGREDRIGANLGQRMGYNPNKGFMDHVKDIGGMVAPALAAFGTGGASVPMSSAGGGGRGGGIFGFLRRGGRNVARLPRQRNISLTGVPG